MSATIKDAYQGHFLIGTAGDVPGGFSADELKLIKENFNVITPENYLKPAAVHPLEDVWTFKRPDALVQWCSDNHIAVHGHTLLWHSQTNAWFFEGGDRDVVIQRMKDHIMTLVGRYKGRIRDWDVVNEAIDGGGGPQTENLRNSQWLKTVGPEYLTLAFKFAHEADPGAKLYYNDYGIENGTKHQNSMVLLKRLIAEGAPVYGVGIQGHWSTNGLPYDALDKAISDYASLGLKISISELDVTIAGQSGGQLGPGGGGPGRGGRGRGAPPATGPATPPGTAPVSVPYLDEQSTYFISTSSAGQPGGRGGTAQPPANPADTLATTVTDLTDAQKSRIEPISASAITRVSQWFKSSQVALLSVQPQYSPGQVAYTHEQEEFRAEQARQNAARDEIINDVEAQLLPILTPAQAQKWSLALLSTQFTDQFGALTLTDEQQAQLDKHTQEIASALASARGTTAVATARADFNVKVIGLLDQTQFTQLQSGGRGGAGRGAGRGATPPRPASAAGLKAQADAYAHLFTIFEKHKDQMDRITFWGLNDARSWRTGQHPLIFDENNQKKPDYQAIIDALLPSNPSAIR